MNEPYDKYKLKDLVPLIIFALLMLSVVFVITYTFFPKIYAQEELKNCHRIEFTDYAYTPFRVYMVFEPPISSPMSFL